MAIINIRRTMTCYSILITLKNLYANYKKFFEVETYENGIRHFTKHLNPSLSTQFQNVYNLWLNKIETVVY